MKSIIPVKESYILSSDHMGRSLTVTITECLSVSTARASLPSWASGNSSVTTIFGVNTIQIDVAAILQRNTECEPQTGYTRNGCEPHCRLTTTLQTVLIRKRPKEARVGPSFRCPIAYAKGIKDTENRYTLNLQNRIPSSGQP